VRKHDDVHRFLFDRSPTGIAFIDVSEPGHGSITEVNQRLATLLGLEPEEIVGLKAVDLLHPDQRMRAREELARLIAGVDEVLDATARLVAGERTRDVRVSARALTGEDGKAAAVVVHVLDLTGVRDSDRDSARRLARAQTLAGIGSFEWVPVTDTLVLSDELFRLFGLRPGSLPGTLRAFEPLLHPSDIATLMDAITSTLADGEQRTFEFRFKVYGNGYRWAEARIEADRDPAGVVARLWGTMQDIDARRLGEDELRGEVAELEQVAGIRAALADGRLRIDEQEIVEVATRRVVLHELLVRMVRSDGTVVAPDDFLPLAERHGVIEEIDRWVLQQAVDLAAAGQAVAVNVSARTMSDPAYRGVALALLADRESTAGRLTFEITETAVVEDFEHASGFARQMRDLGCGVALDDFGTGFGALTYIKKLPAQFLKIDREFVTDLTTDPRSRAVVSGVVTLAKSFGQRTIAEGVEDAETFELLRELGVDFAQGYYLARPVWSAGAGRQA
jgi:PAS domain S-box-containing protein